MNEKFGKEYKLCSKTIIDETFANGVILKNFPFFIKYSSRKLKTNKSFQILISVPKKKFKRAVDRNRIKRLIREGVRKNKFILESSLSLNNQQAIVLVYVSTQEETYQFIKNKIEALFLRLVKDIEEKKVS